MKSNDFYMFLYDFSWHCGKRLLKGNPIYIWYILLLEFFLYNWYIFNLMQHCRKQLFSLSKICRSVGYGPNDYYCCLMWSSSEKIDYPVVSIMEHQFTREKHPFIQLQTHYLYFIGAIAVIFLTSFTIDFNFLFLNL